MRTPRFSKIMNWCYNRWSDGYITATEKKHILAILDAGLTSGRINRTDYMIKIINNEYVVEIARRERTTIGAPIRTVVNTHKFILT